jgi:hypothetical protein
MNDTAVNAILALEKDRAVVMASSKFYRQGWQACLNRVKEILKSRKPGKRKPPQEPKS